MTLEFFIEQYEKGQITEELFEQMQAFAFNANDDELFILAQLYAQLGRVSQAIELVEPLLLKYPEEANLKTFLADLYLDLAEDEKALALLAESDESDARTLLLQADMYMAQGLFEVAEEKLKKAESLEPTNELIKLAKAEYYYFIGEFEAALPIYLDLENTSLSADLNVYERLATCYSHIGEFEKSLEQYSKSEKYFGTLSTDQWFNKGFIANQLGDFDTAEEAFLKVKEMDETYDAIYPLLAKGALKEKEYDKALEYVAQGLQFNEYNPESYIVKGQALEKLQQFEGARDAYYEALNLDPEDVFAARKSIQCCFILEEYDDIIANVATYEENGIVDEHFAWDLAKAYEALESYDEAGQYFETAMLSFNDHTDFLFDFANFILEEGRQEEAVRHLQKILSLDPTHEEAKELLENIM